MAPQLEIIIIALVVAVSCSLPGVFLVLRRMALMSDAISHSILLGIVLTFFWVKDLHSPILILGAIAVGLLTVFLTEFIIGTKRIKEDAAIGLVFPGFFALAVILISKYAGNVHLDEDAVLLGEIALAPFDRLTLFSHDIGPKSLWVMLAIMGLNVSFITLFYKELKISTFDKALAATIGFSPVLLHYSLMAIVSITAVGAFNVVGSILVVALMITPPATAYLLSNRLSEMLALSIAVSALSAVFGYLMAHALNVSISGSMATMTGLFFLAALLMAPEQGLLVKYARRRSQSIKFSGKMLLVHLSAHEGSPNESLENCVSNMINHMGWNTRFTHLVTRYVIDKGYVRRQGDLLSLTALGREIANEAVVR